MPVLEARTRRADRKNGTQRDVVSRKQGSQGRWRAAFGTAHMDGAPLTEDTMLYDVLAVHPAKGIDAAPLIWDDRIDGKQERRPARRHRRSA